MLTLKKSLGEKSRSNYILSRKEKPCRKRQRLLVWPSALDTLGICSEATSDQAIAGYDDVTKSFDILLSVAMNCGKTFIPPLGSAEDPLRSNILGSSSL